MLHISNEYNVICQLHLSFLKITWEIRDKEKMCANFCSLQSNNEHRIKLKKKKLLKTVQPPDDFHFLFYVF